MPASNAEMELLKKFYADVNRNDIPAALEIFDPQIERVEPPDFPTAGTYRGHAELMTHLSKGRGTWAEGGCEIEQLIVAGDNIVAFVHARVRLKDRQEWTGGRFADGFTFRNGKAIYYRSFGERKDALEWAGAPPSVTG